MSRKLTGKYITVSFARKLIGLPGRKASKFNSCIAGKLRGQRGGGRAGVTERFINAAKAC